jgi:hypothetical protein
MTTILERSLKIRAGELRTPPALQLLGGGMTRGASRRPKSPYLVVT